MAIARIVCPSACQKIIIITTIGMYVVGQSWGKSLHSHVRFSSCPPAVSLSVRPSRKMADFDSRRATVFLRRTVSPPTPSPRLRANQC